MTPTPASAQALAVLRHPDRRTAWAVVVAAELGSPIDDLMARVDAVHTVLPALGARLRDETWVPGPPPSPVHVHGDPLAHPGLVAPFDLTADAPVRIHVGAGGRHLAVAGHHAAFDGLGLVAVLAALCGGPLPTSPTPVPTRSVRAGVPTAALRRLARPADRVAPSGGAASAELLLVRRLDGSGRDLTARLATAAAEAAAQHNRDHGCRWMRIGISVGVGGRDGAGNVASYRRIDLRAGSAVGPAVAAALANPVDPPELVRPRPMRLLAPVQRRLSDSLLVSNVGRHAVPDARLLAFFPVARGRSAVAFGAAGLQDGPITVTLRSRDLARVDAEVLLGDVVTHLH